MGTLAGQGRLLGLGLDLSAGWGFELGPVHLRPAAHFGIALVSDELAGSTETARVLTWTPVSLSLAATDLLDERRTGIRVTPVFGATVPTQGVPSPITTLSLGVRVERRLGPVELALRSTAGKTVVASDDVRVAKKALVSDVVSQSAPDWLLLNELVSEGWILPSLSAGLALGLDVEWGYPVVDVEDQLTPRALDSNGNPIAGRTTRLVRASTTSRAFLSWAFVRHFGVTFEVSNRAPIHRFPFFSADGSNATVFSLSLWFRTDPSLERNWLDR